MTKQIDIPEGLLKAGIRAALTEMGAGLADDVKIGGVLGIRPDGQPIRLTGARVTLVDVAPKTTLRLATDNGSVVA